MTHPELPNNREAEQATLGSVLIQPASIVQVAGWLTADLFYEARNQAVYEAMLGCHARQVPPDIRNLADELKRRNKLEAIGGLTYLKELIESVGFASNVVSYAREVESVGGFRTLMLAGSAIARIGSDQSQELDAAQGRALSELDRAFRRRSARGMVSFSSVADDLLSRRSAGVLPGIRTGFRDIDEMLGGLQPSDLIIVGARPSAGKTSLALNLGCNIARAGVGDVLFFSLEMSKEQIVERAVSMESGIDLLRMRLLRMREDDLDAYMQALERIGRLTSYIDDTPAVSVSYIRNQALRHKAERGDIAVVLIDYLQLMTTGKRNDNRVQEVSEISRSCKALAKELGCPVVALSQLSRALEGRPDKRPMLSDLRESGGLEQDADVVLLIYRDEMYSKDTDQKGIAEIIVAKHRQGPIGVVPMRFDTSTTTFSDLTYRDVEGY